MEYIYFNTLLGQCSRTQLGHEGSSLDVSQSCCMHMYLQGTYPQEYRVKKRMPAPFCCSFIVPDWGQGCGWDTLLKVYVTPAFYISDMCLCHHVLVPCMKNYPVLLALLSLNYGDLANPHTFLFRTDLARHWSTSNPCVVSFLVCILHRSTVCLHPQLSKTLMQLRRKIMYVIANEK